MDNWRAGYREDELAGKNRTQEKKATTGGHCPGKADNWQANEGGHLEASTVPWLPRAASIP